MLKMVDGTGIIGVDMICPLGVSTPQPPNYDRVELEGTGMLVLPNSLDAPLERLELGGKTEQVQTSGKNLFDPNNNYEDLVWIRNDGEIVGGSNARTSDYIPVEQGNYTFQFDVINYNQMFVAGYNTGKQFVKIVGTISRGKCIIKIDNIEIETIRLSYTRESTRIQLERSETQTPYEPYTGGKPSPSPEYPQEIKNSGKWNEEKQKYEVDVKITGKNLLDTYEKAEKDSEFYSVNDDGSLSQLKSDVRPYSDVPSTLFLKSGVYYFSLFNTGVTFKCYNAEADEVFAEIKEPKSILVNLRKDANIKYKVFSNGGSSKNVRVMVSKTKASEYEPYTEQTLTLTSDRQLTKWDRLVEQGGQIGWLYGSEILQFTDAEGFKFFHNAQNKAVVNVLKAIDPDYSDSFSVNNSYCTHFINNIQAYYDSGYTCSFTLSTRDGNCLYFKFGSTSDISDLEKFEKWILEKRPVVIYKTKDLQFIPLPQSEQNAIRALKTYYPTTVITADGGELDPDIKATYRKEI